MNVEVNVHAFSPGCLKVNFSFFHDPISVLVKKTVQFPLVLEPLFGQV